MARVLVVHWNEEEAEERAKPIRRAGHEVETRWNSRAGADDYRSLRDDPPDVAVIDLNRLPSHGREVGSYLRRQKATRYVPLIFIEGDQEKTKRVRALLPDAVFLDGWTKIHGAVTRALKSLPKDPVTPGTMAGYSGTPLPKKLGVKPGATVMLLNAPEEFEESIRPADGEVTVRRRARGRADLILLFAKKRSELDKRLPTAIQAMRDRGSIWLAWPKKASGLKSDLSDGIVRKTGLDAGLVDYKIAAIDETWSGLRFTKRK